MKIYKLNLYLLIFSFCFISCKEEMIQNPVDESEGGLFIKSLPHRAEIWLNGIRTDKITPDSINFLKKGSHLISLKKIGYNDTTFSINVISNNITESIVRLPCIVRSSDIFINTYPQNTEIWIDGINTKQTTPDSIVNLYPQSYQVTLKSDGYFDTSFSVSLLPGQKVSRYIILNKKPLKGSIYFTSSPPGAQIWFEGVNSNKLTPDSVVNLDAKNYNVTLKLANHYDTTFTVTVTAGQKATKFVTLREIPPSVNLTFYYVRLYERASSSFSGLVLATGTRQSSSAATTDLYFEGLVSGNLVLRSQSENPSNPATKRFTNFYVGASTNLNDGVASPIYSSSNTNWTRSLGVSSTSSLPSVYNFIYDHDLHYSKFRISASGQEGPFDRWIEITYVYNKTIGDNRF